MRDILEFFQLYVEFNLSKSDHLILELVEGDLLGPVFFSLIFLSDACPGAL